MIFVRTMSTLGHMIRLSVLPFFLLLVLFLPGLLRWFGNKFVRITALELFSFCAVKCSLILISLMPLSRRRSGLQLGGHTQARSQSVSPSGILTLGLVFRVDLLLTIMINELVFIA
jgi:hypothetical protein